MKSLYGDKAESSSNESSFHPLRFAYLNRSQIKVLRNILNSDIIVHSRNDEFGQFSLNVYKFLRKLYCNFNKNGLGNVIDICLCGGAASHVVERALCDRNKISTTAFSDYNDIDITIYMEINRKWDEIKKCVYETLRFFMPSDIPSAFDSFTSKCTSIGGKATDESNSDLWGLVTFRNHDGHSLELKFVERMKRQYQFSVDSFQIQLSLFLFNEQVSNSKLPEKVFSQSIKNGPNNKNDRSTQTTEKDAQDNHKRTEQMLSNIVSKGVLAECLYGDIRIAILHLKNRLIATDAPESIRGGGLLRYCHLLLKGFQVDSLLDNPTDLEARMCTRFLIDFYTSDMVFSTIYNYVITHLPRSPIEADNWLCKIRSVFSSTINDVSVSKDTIYSILNYISSKVIQLNFNCEDVRDQLALFRSTFQMIPMYSMVPTHKSNDSHSAVFAYPNNYRCYIVPYYCQRYGRSNRNFIHPAVFHMDNQEQKSQSVLDSRGTN